MATKIYTKTGDDGTTALFGGMRLKKHHIRIEAYGTVDETNSVIGIAIASNAPEPIKQTLTELSALLFTVGSDLATPLDPPPSFAIPRVEAHHIEWLEHLIDEYTEQLPPLKTFILPGGTSCAAQLHLARTVCRRAERLCVLLAEQEDIGEHVVRFLNRCSDYLFTCARMVNHLQNTPDIPWQPHR